MSNHQATTIAEAKALIQRTAAEHLRADFIDYRSAVLTDGGPDDMRKLVELEIRLIGAEADKKADGFANLPVFNFIIHRGDQQTEITSTEHSETGADVVDVGPIEPVPPLQLAEPDEPVVLATINPVPEQKLGQLLSNLEGLFGPEETGEPQ